MKNVSKVFTSAGTILICLALALTAYNMVSMNRAEKAVSSVLGQMVIPVKEDNPADPELWQLNPDIPMPALEIDGNEYIGAIVFPSLSLELPVSGELTNAKLRKAPCRYSGSAYLGNMVIAGHNYTAHFGKLKNLSPGDEVLFYDTEGNLFRYEVDCTDVLHAFDSKEMKESDWPLTLFTCTMNGRDRITVRCVEAK